MKHSFSGQNGYQREMRERHLFRVLYMLIFGVILKFSLLLTFAIACLQWVTLMFRPEPIACVFSFSVALSRYQQQLIRYLSFHTEEKAFPFAAWPKEDTH